MGQKHAILKEYFENQGVTQDTLAQKLGVDKAHINKLLNGKKSFGKQTAKKWSDLFGLSYSWLLTGEGDMLPTSVISSNSIPFYKDLPVSAGQSGLLYSSNEEAAEGFISIVGVTGKYAFPVIGCSMEPVIHAGDIIVVEEVCQWERIDPDKIYLIITHDDRMIKHLELDEQNPDILWCISSNYKRFSVLKSEIIRIFRVTFYGRLV